MRCRSSRTESLIAEQPGPCSSARARRADGSSALKYALVFGLFACGNRDAAPAPSASIALTAPAPSSAELELPTAPSADASAPPVAPSASASALEPTPVYQCPKDMVLVDLSLRASPPAQHNTAPAYCVDRYEDSVIDKITKKPATPYYPPDSKRSAVFEKIWIKTKGGGTDLEKTMPLPPLAEWEKSDAFVPMAVSRAGNVPQGYASEVDADHACKNAGKRLCTMDEWRTACRGEEDRDFPYGDKYQAGQCNIFGPMHPGILLWNNPSINHTDPRFNLVKYKGDLLLRRTGATKTCASVWGSDAIYDMNGNIDEWVDDPKGMFLGGFYARSKKDGCLSRVTAHVIQYSDYSTGIRCCRDVL